MASHETRLPFHHQLHDMLFIIFLKPPAMPVRIEKAMLFPAFYGYQKKVLQRKPFNRATKGVQMKE
jgi:hypothetical protein